MADLPRFLNICAVSRGFNVRKKKARLRQKAFSGMVVASADTFFFTLDPAAPAVAQLFGGLKKDPEEGFFGTTDPLVEEVDLEDLPEDVTDDHDWPLTWKRGPVLVVPRRAVRSLRTSLMLGGILLELRDEQILVFTPVFRRQQMAAYLTANGWEVEGAKETGRPPVPDRTLPAAEREHEKQARARRVAGTIFLLIGIGLLLWQWSWVQSALEGPTPTTLADLQRLEDPANLPNPWVSFHFNQSQDTGIERVSTGWLAALLRENRVRYVLIPVRDDWLIAEVPPDFTGNELVGYVSGWNTPFARDSLQMIEDRFPGLAFLPFRVDGHYAYRREAIALLVIVSFFVVIGPLLILFSRRSPRRLAEVTKGD
jgi:hypothetical protein